MRFNSHELLWSHVTETLPDGGVVAISGFGGSGKTELAKKVARDVPGVQLVHVDDYLDWPALQKRSSDWDGVLYDDIRSAHVIPFRSGIKPVQYIVIEGIGLFTSQRQSDFDFHIWVDTPIEHANQNGQARDQAFQELWETVWVPNDLEFEAKHNPTQYADAIYGWIGIEAS